MIFKRLKGQVISRWNFFKYGFRYGYRYWFSKSYRWSLRHKKEKHRKQRIMGVHEYRVYMNTCRRARRRIFGTKAYGFCGGGCRLRFPVSRLTIDHIVPISQGGSNDKSNLQVLCYSCHIAKDNPKAIVVDEGWNKPFASALVKSNL